MLTEPKNHQTYKKIFMLGFSPFQKCIILGGHFYSQPPFLGLVPQPPFLGLVPQPPFDIHWCSSFRSPVPHQIWWGAEASGPPSPDLGCNCLWCVKSGGNCRACWLVSEWSQACVNVREYI